MRPELKDLYHLICGKGKYFMMGAGFHSYPDGPGKFDDLHKLCEEIEAEGKIIRQINDPGHVVWVEACEHGKDINDYCEPCGRVNAG
jgi:hypothetical protein